MYSTVLRLPHTNRVHGVRSELEHAIEHEGTTLEKYVTPVPAIIFDDIVSLSLYPQVEPDQGYSSEPPVGELFHRINYNRVELPCHMHSGRQAFWDTEASKCEHAVRQKVTGMHILSDQG